jgi:hypothetical protein
MPARLHITCYRDMARDSNNQPVSAPMAPPIAEAYVDIGPESSASEPLPPYTHFVSIRTDTDCAIAFGDDPVADPDYHIIEPGERLFYGVREGTKIAVIGIAPDIGEHLQEGDDQ